MQGPVALGWLRVTGAVWVAGLGMGKVAWLPAWRGHRQEPGMLQPRLPPACLRVQQLPWLRSMPLLPSLSQSRQQGSGLGCCCPGDG